MSQLKLARGFSLKDQGEAMMPISGKGKWTRKPELKPVIQLLIAGQMNLWVRNFIILPRNSRAKELLASGNGEVYDRVGKQAQQLPSPAMIYSFFDAIAPVLQSKGPNSQYVSYSNSRPTVNGYGKYRSEKGSYNKYSKVLPRSMEV